MLWERLEEEHEEYFEVIAWLKDKPDRREIRAYGDMLRLQKERMDGGFIPSEREYYYRYGLNKEKLSLAKEDAIVMHPGPMNRGVEIDGELADDINRSVIQEQVEMGVAVRMAAMHLLARNYNLEDNG